MYKKFDMSKVPKWLTRDFAWTYESVNKLIDLVFKSTPVKREIQHTTSRRAYLGSTNISEVKHVGIINRVGTEITYMENLGTGYYQNYLELNRDLEPHEYLEVEVLIKPNDTDKLDSQWDSCYLHEDVFEALINKLYETKESLE